MTFAGWQENTWSFHTQAYTSIIECHHFGWSCLKTKGEIRPNLILSYNFKLVFYFSIFLFNLIILTGNSVLFK